MSKHGAINMNQSRNYQKVLILIQDHPHHPKNSKNHKFTLMSQLDFQKRLLLFQ